MLLMGLRLSEGVSLDRYLAMGGKPVDPQKLDELICLGLISKSRDGSTIHSRHARRTPQCSMR